MEQSINVDTPRDVYTETAVTMKKQEQYVSCGNCGYAILPSQARLDIYNTRKNGWEHYHEDYRGCYQSTRVRGRRVILNRFKPWLAVWLDNNYEPNYTIED